MTSETRPSVAVYLVTNWPQFSCDNWFHLDCMQIWDDRVELVDQFVCPLCASGERSYRIRRLSCQLIFPDSLGQANNMEAALRATDMSQTGRCHVTLLL